MLKIKNIGLLMISCLFLLIFSYGFLLSKQIKCNDNYSILTIPENATLSQVAHAINEESCININFFKFAMYMTFNQNNIKYGRYDLTYVNNLRDLINMITSSKSERVKVTIPEGLRIQDIALLLEDKMGLDVEKFIYLCYDSKLIKSLGFQNDIANLEGFLFPDTYIFLKSYTEEDVIIVLVNNFLKKYKKLLNENYKTRYTMEEIITLASIIQGEYMIPHSDELPLISSVYHNRLKKRMYLQADPTIQYILPGENRRLYNKHLQIESPYNTYKYKGLPPGPINNPSLDAIRAAINPADTDYLYFVADGKGRHIFTKTNKQHNKAKYQLKKNRKKY